jgi:hypothetical protein
MGVGVVVPAALDANSMRVGYDKMLRKRSLPEDIYTALSGLTKPSTDSRSIPSAIYMTIQGEALNGSNSAVVTMKKPLSTAGVFGNAVAIGNEEQPTTKSFRVYRNNCRKVISTPGYGVRKLDAEYLRLYPEHINDLSTWNKEQEGLEIRSAFLQQWGYSLTFGDTAALCAQNWNPNIFVCGLPIRSCSPVYSSNVATYTTNIVNTITAAGGGSILPTVNQTLNQPNLSNLSNFALERRITPLSIPGLPGGKGYVLTISERQAAFISDPSWSQRNLGSLIRRDQLPAPTANWPGVIGSYKDLLLVMDVRQPTLNPTGSSAPFGLSAGYDWPGDIDQRYRDDRDVCDTAFLHGANSIFKWEPEKLHHITQEDDYAKVVGHGTARVWGHRIPIYDQQVPNMGSYEYFGGVCVICRLPDYV